MRNRNFRELLEAQWAKGKWVSVGLDSDVRKLPRKHLGIITESGAIRAFNNAIVDATHDVAGVYKPNIAFYEGEENVGLAALRDTVSYIHDVAPETPIILDAKRADIGNTNKGYVQMAFEYLGVDAITVHPYLGAEALGPFLERKDKGIIVLCRTSNPGAGEFQDRKIVLKRDEVKELLGVGEGWHDVSRKWYLAPGQYAIPLYQYVALRVARYWNTHNNCGLVVGATYPEEMKIVRELAGDMTFLNPGIGFQQKGVPLEEQVKLVMDSGRNSKGTGLIFNSARGIIFASDGPDFAEAARRETILLDSLIRQHL